MMLSLFCRSHGAPPEVQRWMIDRITGEGALAKKAQVGRGYSLIVPVC